MPLTLDCVPAIFVGVLVGLVGFLPMHLLVRAVFKGRLKPKVVIGLAVILFSLTLLTACVAAFWVRFPHMLVPFVAGMLTGFFLFMGVTAGWMRRHDLRR